MDKLLTLKEVARLLRLSTQTIYKMVKEGSLTAVKIGNQWRFAESQIETWLKNCQFQPVPGGE